MLLAGAALQIALPSSTKLPDDTDLAPRRVHQSPEPLVEDYPAVLGSPIFAPDRKADATAVPVSGGMTGFMALGVAIAGDTSTALVRGPGGMVQRLKPGDFINGYKLIDVQLNQLTFERSHERHMLTISKAPSAGLTVGPLRRGPLQGQGVQGLMGPAHVDPNANSSSDDDDDSDDNDNNR
jgi:hypothetical protein